jgi:hypothetical protein
MTAEEKFTKHIRKASMGRSLTHLPNSAVYYLDILSCSVRN